MSRPSVKLKYLLIVRRYKLPGPQKMLLIRIVQTENITRFSRSFLYYFVASLICGNHSLKNVHYSVINELFSCAFEFVSSLSTSNPTNFVVFHSCICDLCPTRPVSSLRRPAAFARRQIFRWVRGKLHLPNPPLFYNTLLANFTAPRHTNRHRIRSAI